eukprot:UN02605
MRIDRYKFNVYIVFYRFLLTILYYILDIYSIYFKYLFDL